MSKRVFDAIIGLIIVCAIIFGLAYLFYNDDVEHYVFQPSKLYIIAVVEAHQKEQASERTIYLNRCQQVSYTVGDPCWWVIAEFADEQEYMKNRGSLEEVVMDLQLNNPEYKGKNLQAGDVVYIPITNMRRKSNG